MRAPAQMAPANVASTQPERWGAKAPAKPPQGHRKTPLGSGASLLEVVELGGGSATDLAQALIESAPDDSETAVLTRALKNSKHYRPGEDVAIPETKAERQAARRSRLIRRRSRELVQFVKRTGGSPAGLMDVLAKHGGAAADMQLASAALDHASAAVGAPGGSATTQAVAGGGPDADAAARPARKSDAAGKAVKRRAREFAQADVATAAGNADVSAPARNRDVDDTAYRHATAVPQADAGGAPDGDAGTRLTPKSKVAAKACALCGAAACAPGNQACGTCRAVVQQVKVNSGGVCGRKHVRAAYAELGSGAKTMAVRRRARQLAHADVEAAVAAAVGATATGSDAKIQDVRRRARGLAQAAAASDAGVEVPVAASRGATGGVAAMQADTDGGPDADAAALPTSEAAAKCDVCRAGACAPGNKACGACRVLMRQLKMRTGGVCERKHVRAAFTELGSDAKTMAVRLRARALAQADVDAAARNVDVDAPVPAAVGAAGAAAATQADVGGGPDADAAARVAAAAAGNAAVEVPVAGSMAGTDSKPRRNMTKREGNARTHAVKAGAAAAASSGRPPAPKKAANQAEATGSQQQQKSGNGTAAAVL